MKYNEYINQYMDNFVSIIQELDNENIELLDIFMREMWEFQERRVECHKKIVKEVLNENINNNILDSLPSV